MNDTILLEHRFASDPLALPDVRKLLSERLNRQGWDQQAVEDVVLAIHEAITNIIRHGYLGRSDGKIHLVASLVQSAKYGAGVEISVRDFGRQVPLDSIQGRDLDEPRPGGLGVHIIRSIMDSVEYTHAEGGGMNLLVRKYFKPQQASEQKPSGTP